MIYITHGVVPQWSPERISHALFHPDWLFVLHLQRRPTKYVSLAQAFHGEGDALTIDDATYGGLRAALLALRHGHAVSWFINGLHVTQGLSYFPFQLSSMVDNTSLSDCRFDDRNWSLHSASDRRNFRQHLKARYMNMRSRKEIQRLLEQVSNSLEVESTIEESLRSVTSSELTAAATAGVDLQNHGWSHLNPLSLSQTERTAEALLNDDYLLRFRRTGTRVYAPPFGRRVTLRSKVGDFTLLADRSLRSGRHFGNIFNRCDLRLNDFASLVPVEQFLKPSAAVR